MQRQTGLPESARLVLTLPPLPAALRVPDAWALPLPPDRLLLCDQHHHQAAVAPEEARESGAAGSQRLQVLHQARGVRPARYGRRGRALSRLRGPRAWRPRSPLSAPTSCPCTSGSVLCGNRRRYHRHGQTGKQDPRAHDKGVGDVELRTHPGEVRGASSGGPGLDVVLLPSQESLPVSVGAPGALS